MSLLTIVQAALGELNLDDVSEVIGSTDGNAVQLRNLVNAEGVRLARRALWPALTREHTFSTAASTEGYSMPSDFDFLANDTIWNRTAIQALDGPISAQEYQEIASGLVVPSPNSVFRFRGPQLLIRPVPSSVATIALEYGSNRWCAPAEWVAGTAYAANATVSYLQNRYTTTGGGTAGATPPTHTSGSASDGGVTWAYADKGYRAFVADADITYLPEDLLVLGIKWRFLKAKELAYAEEKDEYEKQVSAAIGRQGGKRVLNLAGGPTPRFPYANLPDTGFAT